MKRDEIKEQLQTWLLEEGELQRWKIGFSENEITIIIVINSY